MSTGFHPQGGVTYRAASQPAHRATPMRSDGMDQQESVSGLVIRARQGDRSAWGSLVERHTSLLWGIARSYRLGTADAADVVQTVWLRLVEHLDTIKEPERLVGWLATTARHECLRVLRRSGRELVGVVDAATDVADDLAPELDASLLTLERDRVLWRCFARLPERCQRLLRVLMVADPPAYQEISQSLGLPIGSIGPTRMRCLTRLRDITEAEGYPFKDVADRSIR